MANALLQAEKATRREAGFLKKGECATPFGDIEDISSTIKVIYEESGIQSIQDRADVVQRTKALKTRLQFGNVIVSHSNLCLFISFMANHMKSELLFSIKQLGDERLAVSLSDMEDAQWKVSYAPAKRELTEVNLDD